MLRSAATVIRFQLQERGTAILCVCVCMYDLRGQVTGIRVRGEDGWLQGDDIQTRAAVAQKIAHCEEYMPELASGYVITVK